MDEERERDRRDRLHRIGGLPGLWYATLGLAMEAAAVLFYILWVLPKTAWLHWSGQLPHKTKDKP